MKPFLTVDDQTTIHLARLELAEPVFELVNSQRHYLRQWLPWVDSTRTVEDTRTFIKDSMANNSNGSRLTTFLLSGEAVAGSLGVVQFNKDHKKCEIGYWLREELQGNGIMTKACACLTDYLFKTKDLNRIEILVASGNLKSQAIPRRLGFTKEGTMRQALCMYGTFYDLQLFSLLKKEWQPSGSPTSPIF